jgi:hypothetical protein
MGSSFIPARQADLVEWSNNFATKIAVSPPAVGLTTAQSDNFTALNDAWIAAYNTYQDPANHTRANKLLKDAAKQTMIANARVLVGVIQKFPSITDAQRADLRITVPKGRTPIQPPSSPPTIKSIVVSGRVAKVTLRGLEGDRRGRPANVQGALVMSFAGPTPPDDVMLWKIEGLATRTTFDVTFPPTLAVGTLVWLSAAWYTARGMAGPACAPVSCVVAGGLGMTMVDALKDAA